MILRYDLTLLNINMSKNLLFRYFSAKKFVLSIIIRIPAQQNLPRFPFEQRTRASLLHFMVTLRLYSRLFLF